MSWIAALRWIGPTLCILATGCTVFQSVVRTSVEEPAEFSWKRDKCRSLKIYSDWAQQVWHEQSPPCASPEYKDGFLVGFVDYIYLGGNGEPPPVPPRRFWNVDWRSPPGHERANQWFAGFRHGASVAREGGYREVSTVDASGSIVGKHEFYSHDYADNEFDGYAQPAWPELQDPSPNEVTPWPTEEIPQPAGKSPAPLQDELELPDEPPAPPSKSAASLPRKNIPNPSNSALGQWRAVRSSNTSERWVNHSAPASVRSH